MGWESELLLLRPRMEGSPQPTTRTDLFLIIVVLPTSMDLSLLSLMMAFVARYSIEMIKKWVFEIILMMVLCLEVIHGISASLTTVIRTSFRIANWVRRMEVERKWIDMRCLVSKDFEWLIMRCSRL
jgi:hypothetical protein